MAAPIRVLMAKLGLDGHDRGAKVITRALRDAGMEVVYTGRRQTPEQIVEAVIQEDVHVLGISILSGAHNTLIPRVISGLQAEGVDDVLIIAGGIIPPADAQQLYSLGVAAIFGPGTPTQDIVAYIRAHAPARH